MSTSMSIKTYNFQAYVVEVHVTNKLFNTDYTFVLYFAMKLRNFYQLWNTVYSIFLQNLCFAVRKRRCANNMNNIETLNIRHRSIMTTNQSYGCVTIHSETNNKCQICHHNMCVLKKVILFIHKWLIPYLVLKHPQ